MRLRVWFTLDDGSEVIVEEPYADEERFRDLEKLVGRRATYTKTSLEPNGPPPKTTTGILKSVTVL